MNNENIGAFLAELRKEKGLNQRELAEKLNVTDKAISKWETGKGMPDVSNLIPLANILEVSVTDILSGKQTHNDIEEENKTIVQVIEQTETKSKRKIVKTIISILLILAIILSTIYVGWFAYWGRRHYVNYNVDTVYLTELETGGYEYEVEVTAHNWLINPSIHSFELRAYIGGEQMFGYTGGTEDVVIVSGLKKTTFKLTGTLDCEHNKWNAKTCFQSLEFVPYEDELRPFSLYMADYPNAKYVFK